MIGLYTDLPDVVCSITGGLKFMAPTGTQGFQVELLVNRKQWRTGFSFSTIYIEPFLTTKFKCGLN
jgi:hypothetical protein